MAKDFLTLLKDAQKPVITGHKDPDGDCLGAIIGLYEIMASMGLKARCILEGPIPKKLAFLDKENIIEDLSQGELLAIAPESSVFVCDCATLERTGQIKEYILGRSLINIDHHIDNPNFGVFNYVFPDKSSTCEIITNLIEGTSFLSSRAAQALASGILYDTGGLRHSNTSAETLVTLAQLQKKGAPIPLLQRYLFADISYEDFKAWSSVLARTSLAAQGKIAWVAIAQGQETREISQKIIDDLKSIAGVEVALVFKDYGQDRVKLSLRSKDYFPVNEFAALWGGGGHARAAGVELKLSLQEAQNTILEKMVADIDGWNDKSN